MIVYFVNTCNIDQVKKRWKVAIFFVFLENELHLVQCIDYTFSLIITVNHKWFSVSLAYFLVLVHCQHKANYIVCMTKTLSCPNKAYLELLISLFSFDFIQLGIAGLFQRITPKTVNLQGSFKSSSANGIVTNQLSIVVLRL